MRSSDGTSSWLSRIVPRYPLMPSIGLDISDTSIKYVRLADADRSGLRPLEAWGDVPVPAGVLDRGRVINMKQLSKALHQCKAESGASFIRVSLPEERAYLFETEIGRHSKQSEVESLLEFKLTENVPIPARDVYYDHSRLDYTDGNTRNTTSSAKSAVAVTAYAKETIEQYYNACLAAGLQPLAFEVEAAAMARAVLPPETPAATMLVDFGKTRTGVGIVYNGVLFYTSTIDIGGGKLSEALRKVLGEGVEESELTRLKNNEGLHASANGTRVRDALLSTISVIADELSERMQYWHVRNGSVPERRLAQIVLCGGSSNLLGLTEYLTATLGVPTRLAQVFERVYDLAQDVPPIDQRHSLGYATAVGLALGDGTINV